jgi:hypothetical protein
VKCKSDDADAKCTHISEVSVLNKAGATEIFLRLMFGGESLESL